MLEWFFFTYVILRKLFITDSNTSWIEKMRVRISKKKIQNKRRKKNETGEHVELSWSFSLLNRKFASARFSTPSVRATLTATRKTNYTTLETDNTVFSLLSSRFLPFLSSILISYYFNFSRNFSFDWVLCSFFENFTFHKL